MSVSRFCFIVLPVLFCARGVLAQEWRHAMEAASRRIVKEAQRGGVHAQLKRRLLREEAVIRAFRAGGWPAELVIGSEWDAAWALGSSNLRIAERIWKERRRRACRKNASVYLEQLRFVESQDATVWAGMVPASAKLIFVGEGHFQDVYKHMESLLTAYSRLYPRRKIIFLTEFAIDVYPRLVRDGREWNPDYINLWNNLQAARIPAAGLEEALCHASYEGFPVGTYIRAEKAGKAARNAHYIRRIKQWREKYPNAVFFIYTGSGHLDMQDITAVPWAFEEEGRFVMNFSYKVYPSNFIYRLTGGDMRPGVLKWKGREAARAAGFDMQIILAEEKSGAPRR